MANHTITTTIPEQLLNHLFALQDFMDERTQLGQIQEGAYKEFCDKMCGGGYNTQGWFQDFQDIITKLKVLMGEIRDVRRRKHDLAMRGPRINTAEALRRALTGEDDRYCICPRCSRPIQRIGLQKHQESVVCKTIWQGRDSVARNVGNVREARRHAYYIHNHLNDEYEVPEVPYAEVD